MPEYSTLSMSRLVTTHEYLQQVFKRVILEFDNSILCGRRGREDQHVAYLEGYSKLDYPNSLHNWIPSFAVDALPYPVNYHDRERHIYFAGFVLGTADRMGIPLIWGGDWNHDWSIADTTFEDFAHFQLDTRKLNIDPSRHRPTVEV